MEMRVLGASTLEVSAFGLGHSMGADDFSDAGRAQFERLIARALELGVNFFDSSDAYWNGRHESWLGQALARQRARAVVATKFGNITRPDGSKATDGRPEYVVSCCEASLKRLGMECIDLYYLHRVDPKVAIEDTIGAMARLVEQGKVRYLGICEAGETTLQRAHKVHPIAALQTEYSLWCREAEEEIIGTCRRLNVAFVGYSPLGRGLLTGRIQSYDDLAPNDRRRIHPRFRGENLARNLKLVARMEAIATPLGLTTAQLALAWAAAQGKDIIPLTGTQRVALLEQSVAAAQTPLAPSDCARLEAIFAPEARAGERYPVEMLRDLGI
ncbi:MAG: Aldo/keto reductase [Ramlibacter sp.]|nr:Aldo/keto reductase [Ramlibacter sp.]